MRVLLIAGGWSSERAVSLSGAVQIEAALVRLGHAVERYDPARDLCGLLDHASRNDFAFLNLHGSPGEDGLIQAMLESVGCPYQGSGPAGSLRALNKAAAKELFMHQAIPTPGWEHLAIPPEEGWRTSLRFPLFLKPNTGGSSLGIALVGTPEELPGALDEFFASQTDALLEEYVQGVEITCPVLGEEPLPPIMIRPKHSSFFDYDSKYLPDGAEEICPAPLDEDQTRKVQKLSLKAHHCLGLDDYSRSDFIMAGGEFLLLEVNTLPGMTGTSLLPRSAAAAGCPFDELIATLIRLGIAGKGQKTVSAR
jgi:D-alanine-D-alanine ligase